MKWFAKGKKALDSMLSGYYRETFGDDTIEVQIGEFE